MKNTANHHDAIIVISEDIYSDGSGSCGLYEVYGQRYSGITTGSQGIVTITALEVPSGHRGNAKTGARALELYLHELKNSL